MIKVFSHLPEHTAAADCGGVLRQFAEGGAEQRERIPGSCMVSRHFRLTFA